MTEGAQFDSSLGGTVEIPPRINLKTFTAAREKEINAMKRELRLQTKTKLAFQRLPKHMRRRVMSHNTKRLPRRLREIYKSQLKKSGQPPGPKKSSRRFRRRPRNLQEEYVRRQRKHTWLETHIWHAKRFHISQKWGYRLALKPCERAFRACYRASTKYCLIQDISYFNCIEISGPINDLKSRFQNMFYSGGNLNIYARCYINGDREGETVLFSNKCSIKKAIGTVYFNWKITYHNSEIHTVWIWIHAAYYAEALHVFVDSFDLTPDEINKDSYISNTESSKIHLIELKNNLNRFRLVGPLSLPTVHKALKPTTITDTNPQWFKEYTNNSEIIQMIEKQSDYWGSLENLEAGQLSSQLILSLIVNDPRINIPSNKKLVKLESCQPSNYITPPENISRGPIWDADVRDNVRLAKYSNAKLAELRSQLLVPGTDIERYSAAIPIMVIQRNETGNTNLGCKSGCDIIIPAGWGNTFWMSLIMWGARAGGLREFDSLRFENGQPSFFAPDTKAGMQEEQALSERHTLRYFKLPPNKRVNYNKLAIVEPFSFNWQELVNEWSSSSTGDFSIIRNKITLAKIQEFLVKNSKVDLDFDALKNCLVPVRLKINQMGKANCFARIFLPEARDLMHKALLKEPVIEDKNEKCRKQMRSTHQNLLKKLRRQRIKNKQKGIVITRDVEMIQKYQAEMKKLWLPRHSGDTTRVCCRRVIGYVTDGNFSFSKAHSYGVGYVALGAIKALNFNTTKNKVLVRNITSRQYRFATLEIIV